MIDINNDIITTRIEYSNSNVVTFALSDYVEMGKNISAIQVFPFGFNSGNKRIVNNKVYNSFNNIINFYGKEISNTQLTNKSVQNKLTIFKRSICIKDKLAF